VNQIAKRDEQQVAAPQSETAAFVSMIERAARDPSVNMDKLERLLAMKERGEARASEQAFAAAMSSAQAEMRPVAADANNPQTHSKYASYMALDKAMRPIYARHGFALSFNTEAAGEGVLLVVCDVSHSGGHNRRYSVPMPADGKGAKGGDVMTKTHAVGAAMTYGQRYLLKMIFNIAVGEDNDQGADHYDRISQEQADNIREALEANGKNTASFLKWAKIPRVEDLRVDYYESAINAIKAPK
jgi:hypothetical protein